MLPFKYSKTILSIFYILLYRIIAEFLIRISFDSNTNFIKYFLTVFFFMYVLMALMTPGFEAFSKENMLYFLGGKREEPDPSLM